MSDKGKTGFKGEEIAALYLKRKGYQILARRFRARVGEIDIVARDHGEIVFVEVKTRGESAFDGAADALRAKQVRRLARTAELFLDIHNLDGTPSRFDVVAVDLEDGKFHIEHFPAAFDLPDEFF